MNCKAIQKQLPDVVLGTTPMTPEFELHLGECSQCAETMWALRATMNLLDEWDAPEPSPYWDVRMQARLREEQQRTQPASAGWLQWFRRPALSLAAALCLVVGISITQAGRFLHRQDNSALQTGTAVSDLQYLDKNSDLLQNFTALDDIDGDGDIDDISN